MEKTAPVKDIMNKVVLTVSPDMPLLMAAKFLSQEGFTGLPVVNNDQRLLGIITVNHLSKFYSKAFTTELPLHLPTLVVLLQKLHVYKKDNENISDTIRPLLNLKVSDVFNPEPLVLLENDTIEQALTALRKRRVDPLPVVNSADVLVGIVTRFDVINFLSPSEKKSDMVLPKHEDSNPIYSENANEFMKLFERDFLLVSKMRTTYWFMFSVLFAVIGFLLAYIIILRINI